MKSSSGETRTVDAHVGRIRKKLGWQDKIKTIPRIGYRLEVDLLKLLIKDLFSDYMYHSVGIVRDLSLYHLLLEKSEYTEYQQL